jgi:hypothetical protein
LDLPTTHVSEKVVRVDDRQGDQPAAARQYAMAEISQRPTTTRIFLPRSAKRFGLGFGGALAGIVAAAYAIETGLAFVAPYAMVATFALLGGCAGLLDPDVGRQQRPASRHDRATVVAAGVKRADTIPMLSAFGTLFANSAALSAALLVVLEAPPKGSFAMTIGFCWLFGVAAQITAGILARVHAVHPEVI